VNDEYALDPSTAAAVLELRFLFGFFGHYQGRFISQFPKGWIRDALNGIQDENIRSKASELLMHEKDRVFVRSGRAYDQSMTWVENVLQQQQQRPFSMAIAGSDVGPNFKNISDVNPAEFPGSRDIKCVGSAENILSACRPLLLQSGSLVLVDPYFSPWKSHTRELLRQALAEAFKARCLSFTAYVSKSKWDEDSVHGIVSVLPSKGTATRKFSIKVCADNGAMHSRYLFSEKGGVRLDRGLQVSRSEIDISLVDKRVHDDLMKEYVERPVRYAITDSYDFSC
jgi:hypothetical protein